MFTITRDGVFKEFRIYDRQKANPSLGYCYYYKYRIIFSHALFLVELTTIQVRIRLVILKSKHIHLRRSRYKLADIGSFKDRFVIKDIITVSLLKNYT